MCLRSGTRLRKRRRVSGISSIHQNKNTLNEKEGGEGCQIPIEAREIEENRIKKKSSAHPGRPKKSERITFKIEKYDEEKVVKEFLTYFINEFVRKLGLKSIENRGHSYGLWNE